MYFQYLPILFVLILGIGNTINGLPNNPPYDVKQLTSQRILGGEPAPKGSAPYMVALTVGEAFNSFLCGGSLISKRIVVTAAHCVTAVLTVESTLYCSLRGLIGSNKLSAANNIITFADHEIHEKYNPWTLKYDAAVLFVTKQIKFTDQVAVIQLNPNWVKGGVKSHVTGWGITESNTVPDELQLLDVVTLSPIECALAMKKAEIQWGSSPPMDPVVEICIYRARGKGMCFGDSGSPLVIGGPEPQQIGIVAWGFPCGLGLPDVAARIGQEIYNSFLKRFLPQSHLEI